MTTQTQQTVASLLKASTTAVEKTTAAMAAAAETNPELNAWLRTNPDAVREAQRVDDATARGEEPGALSGVPCGIKDLIDVAGMPTTAGSNFPHHVAEQDAAVVGLLRAAGAVVLGKTATHEFAYGASGDVAATGPTRNPHDLTRMSGGSSSGSGAAVAAGHVPFALGTDTGGSARIPAALCGIVGLRPTSDTVDSTGVIPLAPTLDTVGILASDVDGASRVWGAISPDRSPTVIRASEDIRVGLIADTFYSAVTEDVALALRTAVRALRDAGTTVKDVTLGWLEESIAVYDQIQGVEAATVHQQRLSENPELFQPEVLQRLRSAQQVEMADYRSALTQRSHWQSQIDEYFGDCDVLICPTTPITAPLIGQRSGFEAGWSTAKEALLNFTSPWSVLGVPALAVPVGIDAGGMPTSVQIIAKPHCEGTAFAAGVMLESMLAARNSSRADTRA